MERFWSKVKKGDGCWEWQAKRNNKGYGLFRIRSKVGWMFSTASRVSYELTYGAIPKGLWVLHTCDNRGCVRPDHLFLGTHSDNMTDMWRKVRRPSAIGPEGAREIRRLRAKGMQQKAIAAQLGVTIHVVKHVTRTQGRTWRHC